MRGVRKTFVSVQQERGMVLLLRSLGVQLLWVMMELKKGKNDAYIALFVDRGQFPLLRTSYLGLEHGNST